MKKNNNIVTLNDFFEVDNDQLPFSLELAWENTTDGNIGSSIAQLKDLCYTAFKSLRTENKERTLFRFVRFPNNDNWNKDECPIIKDIQNNAITLSSPMRFNDPMDPLIKVWVELRKKNRHNDFVEKKIYTSLLTILKNIRICCLVDPLQSTRGTNPQINKCNTLMWAHYADSHKGICIKYEIKPSNLVDTSNRVIRLFNVKYNKEFPLNGEIPFVDALLTKGNYWEYEKECRLLLFSTKEENDYCQLKEYEVAAIYMGSRIGKEKRDCLKTLCKEKNIELYQMEFSKNNISKLEAHKV